MNLAIVNLMSKIHSAEIASAVGRLHAYPQWQR